jgi:glutathione S-transferase
MRHLARVHGVDGKTEEERLAADLVLETVLDFVGAMSRLRFSPQWEDANARAKYAAETVPDHLARLERMLGDKSWASGNEPTYADFMAFEILDTHVAYFPNCLADRPKLSAWVARVRALPTLAAYFPKQRKVS